MAVFDSFRVFARAPGCISTSAFPLRVHAMGCAASARASFARQSEVVPFNDAVGTTEIIPSPPNPPRFGQEVESNRRTLQSLKIAVAISMEDQVDFDDSELDVYRSLDVPKIAAPRNQALPPGRLEHEANTVQVARFSSAAARNPRRFKDLVRRGRGVEEER